MEPTTTWELTSVSNSWSSGTTTMSTSTTTLSSNVDFTSLDNEFWFPSPNATNWINDKNISDSEIVKIRALAWIYVFEIIFAMFGSLFSWGYRLCDTGEGPDPFPVSIGAGLSSYTILIGGVIGFLSIKFNSIINLEVSFYANVLALLISLITIGSLFWSICGSKSHAAYKPANGHTRARIRKSSLFMIIFLSIICAF